MRERYQITVIVIGECEMPLGGSKEEYDTSASTNDELRTSVYRQLQSASSKRSNVNTTLSSRVIWRRSEVGVQGDK